MSSCKQLETIMSIKSLLIVAVCFLAVALMPCQTWALDAVNQPNGDLPPIPDPLGLGGAFSGVSGSALVVAGGTNFPEKAWGEGDEVWHDEIYVLEPGAEQWKTGFKLPHPLANGVSISTPESLICIGGDDSQQAYASVLLLKWTGKVIEIKRLPDLPDPRASAAGALLDGSIYVAGGQTGKDEREVTNTLWRLRLPTQPTKSDSWSELSWETLPQCPGSPRSQAVGAAQASKLFLIGGWGLEETTPGEFKRKHLRDGWRFDPKKQEWTQIPDAPRAMAAAPSLARGESHILVYGGHDGTSHYGKGDERVEELRDRWPGFCRDVLAYHTITNTWAQIDEIEAALVAANAVPWQGRVIVPGGVVAARVRSNQVYSVELQRKQPPFGVFNTVMLVVYMLSLVAMGLYFSRREKSTGDFFVGGRRVPWWAAGISIFGTQLSSISFMAIPAKVYDTDWTYFMVPICVVLVQPLVVFFYLPFFRRLNITSAYEYLEKRFSTGVRLFGSVSFILFQAGRMTVVLFLPALALAAVTGIDIYLCIIVMGVLATIYTALGGIEAVIWTDVIQVFVLVGGALLSLAIVVGKVDGGAAAIFETAAADGKFNWANWSWDYAAPVFWVIVVGCLFQNLISYTADQAVVQRYLTTRDEKTAANAIWTNAALAIPVSFIWFLLGTALYVFYKSHPETLVPTLKTDQTFPLFIAQQLPPGVLGLVIAGLFAASMSTLDSSLNSISTVIVTDFYRRFRPGVDDHRCLSLARWMTIVLGLMATGLALWLAANQDAVRSLWDMYMAVIGLVMGSLTGLFVLGIFTRRTHAVGALVGAASGSIVLFLVQQYTPMHFFLYSAVGIVSCFVIGYLSSLVLPGRKKNLDGLTIYTQTPSKSEV